MTGGEHRVRCPACGRTSTVGRTTCVYCGAETAEPDLSAWSHYQDRVPARARGAVGWYVALAPGQRSPAAIDVVAYALGRDPFAARQLLDAASIVSFADRAEARAFSAALEHAGLRHTCFDRAHLDAIAPAVTAAQLDVIDPGASPDAGPYRGGGVPRRIRITNPIGGCTELSVQRIAFACVGTIEFEIPDSNLEWVYTDDEGRREQVPVGRLDRDRYRVLDLYGDVPAPIRVVEGLSSVGGFNLRSFERAAGFVRLLDWLRAAAAHLRVESGFPAVSADEWDELSARAWIRSRRG